jgi:hypothetical protein
MKALMISQDLLVGRITKRDSGRDVSCLSNHAVQLGAVVMPPRMKSPILSKAEQGDRLLMSIRVRADKERGLDKQGISAGRNQQSAYCEEVLSP